MNRDYAVFCGCTFYPPPGWQGYMGDASTLEEAREIAKEKAGKSSYNWWQVVHLPSREIVDGEGQGHTGLDGYFPANPNAKKDPVPALDGGASS